MKLMDALGDVIHTHISTNDHYSVLQVTSDKERRLAIQECMSTMAKAYVGTSGDNATILEAMMLNHIDNVCMQ